MPRSITIMPLETISNPFPPAVWTHLTSTSIAALLCPLGGVPDGLRFTPEDVPAQDAQKLPLVAGARRLLELAMMNDGLILTPGGLLRRADFETMQRSASASAVPCWLERLIHLPEAADAVFFMQTALQVAGLVKVRSGILSATTRGKALVADQAASVVLVRLCKAALWGRSLLEHGHEPLEGWVQDHAGLILWCLSVSAHQFSTAVELLHSCTIKDTIPETCNERAAHALLTGVLQPLVWLGLLECRIPGVRPGGIGDAEFRKTPLFDRVFKFDVQLIDEDRLRH